MVLLVKLSRNVTEKERKKLLLLLRKHYRNCTIKNDHWSKRGRLLIEGDLELDPTEYQGIWKVIKIEVEREIKTLKNTIQIITDYIVKTKVTLENIELDIWKGVPFHSKAITDRLSKRSSQIKTEKHEATDTRVFIEIRKISTGMEIRLGKVLSRYNFISFQDVALALISPRTKQEIADFLRLSIMFKCPVYISYEKRENEIKDLMKKAKEIAAGHSKAKIILVGSNKEILDLREQKYNLIGFSLWSHKSEKQFLQIISNRSERLLLIFGNEDDGIPGTLREQLKLFHLGPHSSEPLKASQAACYALGLISAERIVPSS